ncbi:hypothetical protein WJX72_007080 [[Myrmecia] bisecta]|uniref:Transmembrane protein 65 n=1 Tax=[Myrmecia] bisecta TaxID=41462 RepID=A0AAW1Q3N1_9CHLO
MGTGGRVTPAEEDIGAAVANSFRSSPDAAAQSIVDSLASTDRAVLLSALAAKQAPDANNLGSAYVQQLFKHADTAAPFGSLAESELRAALEADRAQAAAAGTGNVSVPSLRSLAVVAIAAGVPFVGFGFLDNLIMIAAGDQIEASFGVKFGISTMAAAGLGNLLSDIAGLGLADQIEARARKLSWCRAPPLSSVQRQMTQTRAAKFGGCVVGVSVGCLLGMVPLLWIDQSKYGHADVLA